MSYILNTRTMIAGAATGLFFGLAMAGSAQASATSELNQCKSSSRGEAVACCQEVVRNFGAPTWLGGRDNCNRAVTCGKWSKSFKCWITAIDFKPLDERPVKERGRQSRGK